MYQAVTRLELGFSARAVPCRVWISLGEVRLLTQIRFLLRDAPTVAARLCVMVGLIRAGVSVRDTTSYMVNRLGSISINSHFWASFSCHAWTTTLTADPVSSFTAVSALPDLASVIL